MTSVLPSLKAIDIQIILFYCTKHSVTYDKLIGLWIYLISVENLSFFKDQEFGC